MEIPATTTLAAAVLSQSGGAVLPPGRAVAARIQAILADGLFRVMTAAGPLDLASTTPLPVGAKVTLRAEAGTGRVVVTLSGEGAAPAAQPGPASSGGTTAQAAPPRAAQAVSTPAQATPAVILQSRPQADGLQPSGTTGASSSVRPATIPSSLLPLGNTVSSNAAPLPELAATATAVLASAGEALSPALRSALQNLVAVSRPAANAANPQALRTMVENSGIFHERSLATGSPVSGGNLKAVLLVLRDVLRSVTTVPTVTERTAHKAPAGTAESMETSPASQAARQTPARAAPSSGSAMPAAPLPVGVMASLADVAQATEAALDRLRALQLASIPRSAQAPGAEQRAEPGPASLRIDVPLSLGAATTMLELAIEHEPPKPGEPREGAAWRVWLALDVEPLGPLTALVTYVPATTRVAVTVWTERESARRRLAAVIPELREALEDSDLEPGDVVMHVGAPPRPAARRGLVVDTRT